MIQSQTFTTSLQDTGLGGLGEMESCNRELGKIKKTRVVGDSTNNNSSLVFLGVTDNAGNGDRRTIDTGHKETLQDDLVEFGISTTSKETVKLLKRINKKSKIKLFFLLYLD